MGNNNKFQILTILVKMILIVKTIIRFQVNLKPLKINLLQNKFQENIKINNKLNHK